MGKTLEERAAVSHPARQARCGRTRASCTAVPNKARVVASEFYVAKKRESSLHLSIITVQTAIDAAIHIRCP